MIDPEQANKNAVMALGQDASGVENGRAISCPDRLYAEDGRVFLFQRWEPCVAFDESLTVKATLLIQAPREMLKDRS